LLSPAQKGKGKFIGVVFVFILRSLFAEYKPIEAEAANAENCDRTENDADNCACAESVLILTRVF
jgi:hypothetical protein